MAVSMRGLATEKEEKEKEKGGGEGKGGKEKEKKKYLKGTDGKDWTL